LRILERINKDDSVDDCKLIGEVAIKGLQQRPRGKTRLRVTLLVEEEGGLVKGVVEDLGFNNEYQPSGYLESFDPSRFNKRVVGV